MFPHLFQHINRPLAPQVKKPNFQPHYDALKNNHINDPVKKVKLDALEFDGRLDSIAF